MKHVKKKIGIIFLYLFFFFILEIVCYFLLTNQSKLNQNLYIKNFKLEIDKINKHKRGIETFLLSDSYTSKFGWDNYETEKLNEIGARKDILNQNNNPKYVSFGSSFTWGDGVNDDQTWQHYLSQHLNHYVANFGVGGYSVYQALLKSKDKNFNFSNTEISILTIFESEIDRIRNGYLNFYFNSGYRIRPLPRIYKNQIIHHELPTFINNKEVLIAYLKYINKIKEKDFWWQRRINIKFPFSINYLQFLFLKIQDRFEVKIVNTNYKNTWNNDDTNILFKNIIKEFIIFSENRKIKPVIVLLPRIRNKLKSGYKYQKIKEELLNNNICILDFADYINLVNLKNNNMTVLKDGHYSEFTYQKLSEFLSVHLKKNLKDKKKCLN